MKHIFRLLVLAVLLGGWALAGASLYVVRSAGDIPWVGNIHLIPKDHLSFQDTYVDVQMWKSGDELFHREFYDRMVTLRKTDILIQPAAAPAPDMSKMGG